MIQKFKGPLSKILRVLKFLLLGVFLTVIAASLAGFIWLQKQPLTEYKKLFLNETQKALVAEGVSAKVFAWDLRIRDLSFGILVRDLEVKNFGNFESLKVARIRLATQPLKILFGKFPAALEIGEPQLRSKPRHIVKEQSASAARAAPSGITNEGPSIFSKLPAWTQFLRLTYRLEDGLFEQPLGEKESVFRLENVGASGLISGLPGTVEGKIGLQFNVDDPREGIILQGPIEMNWEGYFQKHHNEVVGFKIDKFSWDLSRVSFSGPYHLEKSPHQRAELSASAQVLFTKSTALDSIRIEKASVSYDQIRAELSGEYNPRGAFELRWVVNPVSLQGFHAPFRTLREASLNGLFESNGKFSTSLEQGLTGHWKVSLNNFSVNPAELSALFEKESSGALVASLVSEGTLKNGRVNSPKTEFQLKGSEAGLVFKGEKIAKPKGDALDILLKAKVFEDVFSIDSLSAKIHTLDLKAFLKLERLSEFMAGKEVPLQVGFQSNRIDLSKWRSYLRGLEKAPPLEGFFEFAGSAEGLYQKDQGATSQLSWRVDRASLSNFRSAFNEGSVFDFSTTVEGLKLRGPFSVNFIFQGRGLGSRVDRATLLSRVDLSHSSVLYRDFFRKPESIPLLLEVSGEQTRNQLKIRRGDFSFHNLDLNFAGTLVQGNRRSFVQLNMARPVRLSDWKDFFIGSQQTPVDGTLSWTGRVGFPEIGSLEDNFDWRQLSLEGRLELNDLRGRLTQMKSPLRGGRAVILFQPTGVLIPNANLAIGSSKMAFSGEVSAMPGRGSKKMNLHQLLIQKAWDLKATVNVDQLNPEDFASPRTLRSGDAETSNSGNGLGASVGETLRSWFEKDFLRQSRMRLAMTVGKGRFAKVDFKNLQMRALWENNLFKMQPLSLEAFGGKLGGTMTYDLNSFYARKDLPELSSTLKVSTVDIKAMLRATKAEMEKMMGGSLDGQMILVSKGWEPEDLVAKSRGRIAGTINRGELESLELLRVKLDELISQSAAKDFLLKQASQEKCLQRNFSADLDSEIKAGVLEIGKADLSFQTGSDISLTGKITQDMNLDLAGNFFASSGCLSGDIQKCLSKGGSRAAIPFKISGPSTQASATLDSASLAQSIVKCVTEKTVKKAEAAVRSEIERRRPELEDMAKERLKKIFK